MTRTLNFWPAFSDMMLALFICGVTAAAVLRREKVEIEGQKQALEGENTALRQEITRLKANGLTCSAETQQFIDTLVECVETDVGRPGLVAKDVCAVSVGEDLVGFRYGLARPLPGSSGAHARTLARCLYDAEKDFLRKSPAAFGAIESIYLDGHTDCKGDDLENVRLGAERAMFLYDLYRDEANKDGEASPEDVKRLVSKVNLRSFGSHLPTKASECATAGKDARDRRVTVAVKPRVTLLQSNFAEPGGQ
jgi:hypothetical protein